MNAQAIATPPPEPVEEEQKESEGILGYISASRLKCFQECRLKFFFKYVARVPVKSSPALHVGQVVHGVLRIWNLQRWRGDESDADSLKAEFEAQWADQPEEGINWGGKEADQKTRAWSIFGHYVKNTPIPEDEKPEAVEVVVERDLDAHGLPPLMGIIDLVRSGGRIVDFKTSSRSPDKEMTPQIHGTQLGCYALLYREATGQRESGFELHFLIKTKEPKLAVVSMNPVSPVRMRRLIALMHSYVRGIEDNDFVPSPGMQCAWCDFREECRNWG